VIVGGARFLHRLRLRRFQTAVLVTAIVVLAIILAVVLAVIGVVTAYGQNLPNVDKLSNVDSATTTTRIIARDGTVLARIYDKNRIFVSITDVAPVMRQAIVASEDERFFEHRGVDLRSIIRAAVADFKHEPVQGASTITQQLARTLFLNRKRTIARKVQEALLAIELERYYTKDEILERYLNLIYFGAGAYGIQAASHAYFGKDASKLTLPEAAMLAGVVAAPSEYSPFADPSAAKVRQRRVLERMVGRREIARSEADAAAATELKYVDVAPAGVEAYKFPYFTTYVVAELERDLGTDALLHGGLTVYTTLDPHLQILAQRAVTEMVELGRKEGYGMHQGALVAEDPRNGQILAMVGGVKFSAANQFNRAWQARRQPGSSFKGYVYSAAVDRGVPVSTIYSDSPVTYPAGDGTDYSPVNDDHRFLGPMPLRRAFALSRNVVAVKLAYDIGIDNVITYAHAMGITEDLEADVSLALGTAVVSPLDMVSGYSTIANGGVYSPPTAIRYVTDRYGVIALDNHGERHPGGHGLPQRDHRASGCRQDGDDVELPRRLVRRLRAPTRRGRVGGQRRLFADVRVVRRERAGAPVGAVHENSARRRESAEVRHAAGCRIGADLRRGQRARARRRRGHTRVFLTRHSTACDVRTSQALARHAGDGACAGRTGASAGTERIAATRGDRATGRRSIARRHSRRSSHCKTYPCSLRARRSPSHNSRARSRARCSVNSRFLCASRER